MMIRIPNDTHFYGSMCINSSHPHSNLCDTIIVGGERTQRHGEVKELVSGHLAGK